MRKSTAGESIGRRACWALLLGAGEGRRFGGSKLVAPLRGRPLVAYVLETIGRARRAGSLAGGVGVVGRGDARLSELVGAAGLRVVENDDPGAGLARSLELGLAALEGCVTEATAETAGSVAPPGPRGAISPAAAVVFLGDQPFVRAEVVELLVEAWLEAGGVKGVVRPRYALSPEAPGHPVLVDRSIWPRVSRLKGDVGLGPLLREHPEWVTVVDVAGDNPGVDIPADLAALQGDRDDGVVGGRTAED